MIKIVNFMLGDCFYKKKSGKTKKTLTAPLFKKSRMWKQPECPMTHEWISYGMCVCIHTHTHTEEYYSARKMNEIGSFAEKQMDLQSVV